MTVYILWASSRSGLSEFILDIYSSYAAAYEEKCLLEARGDNEAFRYSIEEREVIGEGEHEN